MPYDWTADDDNPQLSDGYHFVEVIDVRTTKKDGGAIISAKGEEMIFVTIQDTLDSTTQDVPLMLEGKGVGFLKMLLSRTGADLQKMKDDGIEPRRFSNPTFAQKQLIGRRGWCNVVTKNGRANAAFVKVEEVPPLTVKAYGVAPVPAMADANEPPPPADADIPF